MVMGLLVLRRCGKTAALAAAGYTGESLLFLFDYLLRFARVVVLLALWHTILGGRGVVSGMTLGAVLTYTLVAEVFHEPLTGRTLLDSALWDGTIATRLMAPLGLVAFFAAEAVGRWCVGFLFFSLPLLLCAPLLGVDPLPASAADGALFVVSLALGIAVGLAIDFLFAGLTVAMRQNPWIINRIRVAITVLLSGSLLPLALLPWRLGDVFGWLPFASMASAPLKIYTGTGHPLPLLLIQAGWAVVLWPLARWLWRANRE